MLVVLGQLLGVNAVGTQSCSLSRVKSSDAGMTPMTVAGRPSRRTCCPITARSAPKRRRQSRSLSTTT